MATNRKRLTRLSPARSLNPDYVLEQRLHMLRTIYLRSQEKIIVAMTKSISYPNKLARLRSILAQVEAEIGTLDKRLEGWNYAAAEEAFNHGVDIARESARATGATIKAGAFARIQREAIAILSDQLLSDLMAANGGVHILAGRYLRRSRLDTNLDDSITQFIGEDIISGVRGKATTDRIRRETQKRIGAGELIQVGQRNFNLVEYAELLGRTRMREAVSYGTIAAASRYGMDLVQVDVHGDACPLCQTRMGRVFSISGTDPDFPALDFPSPFHPNCRCNIFPITREFLEGKEELRALIGLSNRTPRFDKAGDAKKWLEDNPGYQLATLDDYKAFVGGYKRP